MSSPSTTTPFTCVTCEIAIAGPATFHVGLPFCCAGCVAGGPCTCSYDIPLHDSRVRHCLDVEVVLGDEAAGTVLAGVGGGRR